MSAAVYDSARQRIGVESLGKPILWQAHGTYSLKGFDKELEIGEAGIEGIGPMTVPATGDKAKLVRRAKQPTGKPAQFAGSRGSRLKWPSAAIGLVVVLGVVAGAAWFAREPKSKAKTDIQSPLDATGPVRSVAVLPFENLMHDAKEDYFSDGMTEALITELAKIKGVKVISRTSVMQYKDVKNKTMPQIAQELGVDSLVEGSVLKDGNQVRITAQLIRGATDEHLWAQAFTNTMENVLQLQSEVALKIAEGINAIVTPQESARIVSVKKVDPEAYGYYLQGRYFWDQRSLESLDQARTLFERAIDLDPGFVLAHVGLADALLLLVQSSRGNRSDARLTKARDEARIALELAPQSGEAYATLGMLRGTFDWQWAEADEAFLKGIELSPSYATGYQWYGSSLAFQGRAKEALAALQKAHELDPVSPIVSIWLAQGLASVGRAQEGMDLAESLAKIYPDNSRILQGKIPLYLLLGRFDDALQANEKRSDGWPNDKAFMRSYLLARAGRAEESRQLLEKLLGGSEERGLRNFSVALTYAALNDTDKVFESLERAYEAQEWILVQMKSNFAFNAFHDDPRYKNLLRRMNFPETDDKR
jgi:TolB-like protein